MVNTVENSTTKQSQSEPAQSLGNGCQLSLPNITTASERTGGLTLLFSETETVRNWLKLTGLINET